MILLLDANNLGMRSYHAAHGSMSSGGMETGALQIFVTSLAKHIRDENPRAIMVCWDSADGSQYRAQLYPNYKLNRWLANEGPTSAPHAPLFALIREFLQLAGIQQWTVSGVEADDLIANVCRSHGPGYREAGEKAVILSSDKDLLQLLDKDTEQVRFSSASAPTDRWTARRVFEDMGYRPDQIPLVMALTGDASDNIPGVRGLGPKKAVKLLQEADWDFDRALDRYPAEKPIAQICRRLVDLAEVSVAVPFLRPFPATTPVSDALLSFCDRYELRTLKGRLLEGTLWRSDPIRRTSSNLV